MQSDLIDTSPSPRSRSPSVAGTQTEQKVTKTPARPNGRSSHRSGLIRGEKQWLTTDTPLLITEYVCRVFADHLRGKTVAPAPAFSSSWKRDLLKGRKQDLLRILDHIAAHIVKYPSSFLFSRRSCNRFSAWKIRYSHRPSLVTSDLSSRSFARRLIKFVFFRRSSDRSCCVSRSLSVHETHATRLSH